jgi:EAL domain-containing protein (putative c-di-GMP-specific phosphodiesterase class I)
MSKPSVENPPPLPTLALRIFNVAFIMMLCLLCWVGVHEINSVNEMKKIINADLQSVEQHASSLQSMLITEEQEWEALHQLYQPRWHKKTLQAEAHSYLNSRIERAPYVISALVLAVFFLITAVIMMIVHSRRLALIKRNQQQLEELLYYDQLMEVDPNQTKTNHLDPALLNLQKQPTLFAAALEHALIEQQFVLQYQPIVNADNEQIVAVEALLYWQHPTFGLLNPGVFLPFCEKNGFIVPLGEWVLRHACKQVKKWHEMGHIDLCVSINLSAHQLKSTALYELISDAIKHAGILPKYIKLEVTESVMMHNVEANIKLLNSLRDLGVQLALDDFGTGYSSLNYLKQFPFSILKIDKSFIADMTTNITSVAIVESIVALGKSLGLTLVAEGIENKNQLHLLRKMKCDLIQGYLYSKPVSAHHFSELLSKSNMRASHRKSASIASRVYHYETLKAEHRDQAIQVITQTFCENEPMTRYLAITHREFTPFAELLVDKAIKDGLSMVALDDNKLTACSIVEDIANPLDINIDIDPRFKTIFSLLEHLGSDFFHEKILEKDHIAHLFITAVSKEYCGEGLSSKINFESIQLAKHKGFDFMCCEFTHHYNEKGTVKHIKNSKLLIRSCYYKDFIFEGKKPFQHLEGHASAYIWELREGAKLRYQITQAPALRFN